MFNNALAAEKKGQWKERKPAEEHVTTGAICNNLQSDIDPQLLQPPVSASAYSATQ